jgi:phosphate uptake regulator
LPKEWVQKNKLKKGSNLSMDINSDSILISTDLAEEAVESTTTTINTDNKSIEEIETEIITAYLTNYNIIEIISKNLKSNDGQIKDIIMNLAGLEILEQTNTKITAKFLMDLREISLDSLVRRMDNITRSLVIDAVDCIRGSCNYSSIKQRDIDVNRLNFLIMRTIRQAMNSSKQQKKMVKTTWQLYTYLVLAEKLEKIADRQKRIARCLEQLKLSPNFAKELLKVYTSLKQSYIDVMTAYYKEDKKAALQIEMTNKERIFACDKLLSKDIKKEYKMLKKGSKDNLMTHVHEHMIMTVIITNLKAMATSVKLIARTIMNKDD